MRVPCPGWLEMLIVPPDASTRSLRPMSPEPRDGSAPPVPSSWIDTCRTPSRTSTPTRTTEEPALGAVDPDVPVFESDDAEQVDGEVEDTLQLPLGSEVPAVDLGEGVDGVV